MIYVDEMHAVTPNKNWPYPNACHMFADSKKELLFFARQVGLKKSWMQTSSQGIIHFDLTFSKRKIAVREGAQEVRARDIVPKLLEALK